MGNIKNILQHCQENEKDYIDYGVEEKNENRLINLGWIQALRFIEQNFDIEEKQVREDEN
jgi:hypothetical protein